MPDMYGQAAIAARYKKKQEEEKKKNVPTIISAPQDPNDPNVIHNEGGVTWKGKVSDKPKPKQKGFWRGLMRIMNRNG
jgi:hypothetical protein